MMQNGFSLTGMMLAGSLGVDLVSSLTSRASQVPGDVQSISPIFSFFLSSWRSNSFTDENIQTNFNQVFSQACMIFGQLFFLLMCFAEGQVPMGLGMAFMTFIGASMYSFFNPSRVTAINAL
jgi:FtsH-binding integral membrane protein